MGLPGFGLSGLLGLECVEGVAGSEGFEAPLQSGVQGMAYQGQGLVGARWV